jgi:hypothetical protein
MSTERGTPIDLPIVQRKRGRTRNEVVRAEHLTVKPEDGEIMVKQEIMETEATGSQAPPPVKKKHLGPKKNKQAMKLKVEDSAVEITVKEERMDASTSAFAAGPSVSKPDDLLPNSASTSKMAIPVAPKTAIAKLEAAKGKGKAKAKLMVQPEEYRSGR